MAAGAVDMVEADLTPGGKSSTHLARFSPCFLPYVYTPPIFVCLDLLSTASLLNRSPTKRQKNTLPLIS
jgi:hypothetical protein